MCGLGGGSAVALAGLPAAGAGGQASGPNTTEVREWAKAQASR
jgi:hypothetical protein